MYALFAYIYIEKYIVNKILVGLIVLLGTTLVTASDTVFEINNTLSNVDNYCKHK